MTFPEKAFENRLTTLVAADKILNDIKAYYNFNNAYLQYQAGNDSYRNICLLTLYRAGEIIKRQMKIITTS